MENRLAYKKRRRICGFSLSPRLQEFKRQFKADGGTFEEYKVGELFDKIKVNVLKYKTSDLPNEAVDEYDLPALTAGIRNQGLNNYVPKENATILKNVISISANGANTGATFYQSNEFTVLQDAYAIKWIYSDEKLTDNQYLYLVGAISKTIYGNYEWTNKAGWERIKNDKIYIPTYFNGEIAFSYMENYIRELGNERLNILTDYLKSTGLENTELTQEEMDAVIKLRNGDVVWKEFRYDEIFNHIEQGRRLKKDDQKPGDIPFIMSGVTNTGVVNYISNPVASFPSNSITVDIFGNTFYRDFAYGLGDDTGAYYNDEKQYTKDQMLFFTSAIRKSLKGKFSYGNKLRSSQSFDFKIRLPACDGIPDYTAMDNFIIAMQKLAIRGVVKWMKDFSLVKNFEIEKSPSSIAAEPPAPYGGG